MRCCPMAESLFILELEFLHIRGGCSLVVVFFVLKKLDTLFITLRISASGYLFRFTFRLLSDISYSDECRMKKAFQYA